MSIPKPTFSPPDTMAIRWRGSRNWCTTSSPSTYATPDEGRSNVIRILIMVVFAGAVGTEHAVALAARDAQVDAVQCDDLLAAGLVDAPKRPRLDGDVHGLEDFTSAGRSGGLDGGDQLRQGVLGVAEEHDRLGVVEQLVIDAGEAGAHAALHEHDVLRLVGVEDGHPIDRAARRVVCRRVDHVVGANDERDVRGLELVVDLVHLLELVVGDVRLSKEYVHV